MAIKENANPTIVSVDKGRSYARRAPFDWSQLGTFEKTGNDWVPTSAEDGAIYRALVDTAKATKGKNVTLLQNAGLFIPTDAASETFNVPSFAFSNYEEESKIDTSSKDDKEKEFSRDKMSSEEIFDIIRTIQDPEHPNTLEELGVVSLEHVEVIDDETSPDVGGPPRLKSVVTVRFTPTIPHCSMATLIGLSLTVKLKRSIPQRFKVDVRIEPGTHASEKSINKQLRDKERVCAALENKALVGVVNKCIRNGGR